MKAELLARKRFELEEELIVETVLWRVPAPVPGSSHSYKYRLALIDRGVCVLRYDNEAGKGDHKHVGAVEFGYLFSTVEALEFDFLTDVSAYRKGGRQ